jgi:hypothetical protein
MYSEKWAKLFTRHIHTTDPIADRAVDTVYHGENGEDSAAVGRIFRSLVTNCEVVREEMPPCICAFLDATNDLPEWADQRLLAIGADVFNSYSPQIVLILHLVSLPVLYAAGKGVQILTLTGRMNQNIDRRIFETAGFVFDVTADNAFHDDGGGIVGTQKVRLMHAAIRHFIDHDPRWQPDWKRDEWGAPIHQAALAVTMLSFSTVVLNALEKTGMDLTVDEKEGYLHLWKVTGHILGVHEDLIPKDFKDSQDMFDTFAAMEFCHSDSGVELTKTLIEFVQRHLGVLPKIVPAGMRFWLGGHLADMLGIPKSDVITETILGVMFWIWRLDDRFKDGIPLIRLMDHYIARSLMMGLLALERGGNRPPFHLPANLQDKLSIH